MDVSPKNRGNSCLSDGKTYPHDFAMSPISLLNEHLKHDGPGSLTGQQRRTILATLEERPEAVTEAWLMSTARPTTGVIRLRGNQRTELHRRAADYLERANRAWRAALSIQQSGPPAGEVDRRRERLLETLPVAREQSRGMPWFALFERLTKGLQL